MSPPKAVVSTGCLFVGRSVVTPANSALSGACSVALLSFRLLLIDLECDLERAR